MLKPDIIEGIFRNLDGYLNHLRRLAALPQEQFTGDPIRLGAAKYYLQIAVECCIDVAHHIIARNGFRSPDTYADTFAVLAENGVIESEFAHCAEDGQDAKPTSSPLLGGWRGNPLRDFAAQPG
jgi:uncharacterized protein YutE (UPF0331/DUF86 family)